MSDTVHGASCSYTNLSNYNSSSDANLNSPAFRASSTTSHYVIPQYGSVGYTTLTHDKIDPSCVGYFNIQSAYGPNAEDCTTQYVPGNGPGNDPGNDPGNCSYRSRQMMRNNQFQGSNNSSLHRSS